VNDYGANQGGGMGMAGKLRPHRQRRAKRDLWPNPRASERGNYQRDRGKKGAERLTLTGLAKKFPTPHANCHTGPGHASQGGKNLQTEIGGAVNPTWVELLMGFPQNWTRLYPINHLDVSDWIKGFTNEENKGAFKEMQNLPENIERPPYQPRHNPKQPGEYPDPLQVASRLSPFYGEAAWKDGRWENGMDRLAVDIPSRVDRLTGLGNAQVPACAARAFLLLVGSE